MKQIEICVIGLGYIGLPLACEFSKKYKTIGYDCDFKRIKDLKKGIDHSLEVRKKDIISKNKLKFTNKLADCKNYNYFIICVPTPINKQNKPNISALKKATKEVGSIIKKNDLIIFESTVYPGVTEDICVPILEKSSELKYNKDFFCGYSPERINPGDKKHSLVNIKKVTSGSDLRSAKIVDNLYKSIVIAGTHLVSSIKVAEASKIIENIQRDINIALINELSIIFNKLKIDTNEIIQAAATKWNFHSFSPGLVGGHCIGVDPYYLTFLADKMNHIPKMILAGRFINEFMSNHVCNEVKQLMIRKKIKIVNSRILVMGYTFKENCPDTRNTKVKDLISHLIKMKCKVDVYDPWINKNMIKFPQKAQLIDHIKKETYDTVIIAVSHSNFNKMGDKKILSFAKKNNVIFDVKNVLKSQNVDGRL